MTLFESINSGIKDSANNLNFRAYLKNGGYIEFTIYGLNPPLKKDEYISIVESSTFFDSKKQEIFNGDIFVWGKDSRGIITMNKGTWIIENENGTFNLFGYKNDGYVIGNIFQNQNLLMHKDLVPF